MKRASKPKAAKKAATAAAAAPASVAPPTTNKPDDALLSNVWGLPPLRAWQAQLTEQVHESPGEFAQLRFAGDAHPLDIHWVWCARPVGKSWLVREWQAAGLTQFLGNLSTPATALAKVLQRVRKEKGVTAPKAAAVDTMFTDTSDAFPYAKLAALAKGGHLSSAVVFARFPPEVARLKGKWTVSKVAAGGGLVKG